VLWDKRRFNTLSAGFVMRDNRPLMTVTLIARSSVGKTSSDGDRGTSSKRVDQGFVGKYYAIDKEKLVQWSISSSRLNWKE
jgi:hypothetical protein